MTRNVTHRAFTATRRLSDLLLSATSPANTAVFAMGFMMAKKAKKTVTACAHAFMSLLFELSGGQAPLLLGLMIA